MQQALAAIVFNYLPAPGPPLRSMRKSRVISQNTQDNTMDAEHINQIGNTLIDLTERTQELRGYL